MDDPKRIARPEDSDAPAGERRPSFLNDLAGFIRDEAIDHMVSSATGGWLGYDGADDEDEEPRKAPPKDGFNERLERALAEMRAQQQTAETAVPVARPFAPATEQPAAAQAEPLPRPMASNLAPAVRGFGRKQV